MNPRAVVIATGDELVRGERLETNGFFLARELFHAGFTLVRAVIVGDALDPLAEEVRRALPDADLVCISGGLGPTDDDLTRGAVAAALGVAVREDAAAAALVRRSLEARGRPYTPLQARQALLPDGCALVPNPTGTAPGFWCRRGRALLVALPGVPGELEAMWRGPVARVLAAECPERAPPGWKILRCFGLGESEVQRRVAAVCPEARPGEIGMCAEAWAVAVYLAGRYAACARDVRAALEPNVFGEDDDTLATVLVQALVRRGLTCAVAESLTGGGLGYALTSVPGASEVFRGGTIAYAEAEKVALGVSPEILAVHGAVSAATAEALAAAARRRHEAALGLATTGYAGPSGGTGADPAGTVYIAAATAAGCRVRRVWAAGGRAAVRQVAINYALAMGLGAVEEGFGLQPGM